MVTATEYSQHKTATMTPEERQIAAARSIILGINQMMQNPITETILSESEIEMFNKLRMNLEAAIRKSEKVE